MKHPAHSLRVCKQLPLLRLRLLPLLLLALLPAVAIAEEKARAEQPSRMVEYATEYRLNDDFTSHVDTRMAVKVLQESAIDDMKTSTLSYSTSIETLDVLEAYTLKADGRKVPVPKDNFQKRINKGNRDGGPVFSDRTSLTVVFPDLAVNDTVYFSYRLSQTEPMFPGHFSAQGIFSQEYAYDDARVRIDVPAALAFVFKARGMKEKIVTQGGRKVIELSWKNPEPVKGRRRDYSVFDPDSLPGFAFSTFSDYALIAAAYGERALPKAQPNERVKKLAADIVGKERDKLTRARKLYDWVANNITYAGNCIGVGAVVPHDITFILDNRMGDCKDHATLLQALLAAQGISSTQALVNSGSLYGLPAVPMVSSVNHVINYLPEWDRFVDATSHDTPFDMLPFSVSDKPVLLVEGYRAGLRTPKTPMGQNRQAMQADLQVQPDGSVKGKISLSFAGGPAASARAAWRDVTPEQEQDWIEGVFSSQGSKGIGSISKDDPEPLESRYNFSVDFEKKAFMQISAAGAFHVFPLLPTPAPVHSFVDVQEDDVYGEQVACSNGISSEEYVIHLPDNMKILALPDNMEISEQNIHYLAEYSAEGNVLKVKRLLEDKTPGNVCPAALIRAQKSVLLKITDNLRSQVVYQNK